MKRVLSILALGLLVAPANAAATTIFLDADTPATGSLLGVAPLVTAAGTITFAGEIRDRDSDPEFNAAGALGDVFDIADATDEAVLAFDFDVSSISFIYGGNFGVFDVVARDGLGAVVDAFFQASTDGGQPAGPITLSGTGIRSLLWRDPGNNFAPIDNVTIETTVPEPTALWLLGLAGAALLRRRTR